MTDDVKRVALLRRTSTFAILLLAVANLAYSAAPDLAFTPTSLNFKYQVGSALPASQSLAIKSTGTALTFTLSITGPLPYSAQWLSISANSGTTAATIKVYVNPTGLPSGSYSGTIVASAPSAATPTHNFPVTLDVGDAPATLTASTNALTFDYTTGAAAPASQPIVLITTGAALSASIAVTGGNWLKASPTGNIALVGLPGTVTVTVDPTGTESVHVHRKDRVLLEYFGQQERHRRGHAECDGRSSHRGQPMAYGRQARCSIRPPLS